MGEYLDKGIPPVMATSLSVIEGLVPPIQNWIFLKILGFLRLTIGECQIPRKLGGVFGAGALNGV